MRARFDLDDATYFSIIYKIESQSGNLAHLRNAYVRQIRIPTNSTFQYRSFILTRYIYIIFDIILNS